MRIKSSNGKSLPIRLSLHCLQGRVNVYTAINIKAAHAACHRETSASDERGAVSQKETNIFTRLTSLKKVNGYVSEGVMRCTH